jgi:hypothetical protein
VSNPGGDATGYYGGNGQDYSGYNQQSIYPQENNSNTGVALSLFTINSTIITEMALQTTLAITSNSSSKSNFLNTFRNYGGYDGGAGH